MRRREETIKSGEARDKKRTKYVRYRRDIRR